MGLFDSLAKRRTARQIIGQQGEDRALSLLLGNGLTLVERNFRCKGGEIDLIMQQGATLVFVEVRKRAQSGFGGAADTVTARKQTRLIVAAQVYLQRYRELPACRFDVVAIDGDRESWLRNAFEA